MKSKIFIVVSLAALLVISFVSCKRTFFHVTEEVANNETNRFTVKKAYYQMGKSIALTAGRYELTPGDSIVLFVEGQGRVSGIGSEGVVGLDIGETARIYMTLPVKLQVMKYDLRFKAICEITGSLNYSHGENLFVCQSGQVVIDSLKGNDIFGTFKGSYLNTSNKSLKVEGPFKAGLK